MLKRRLPPARFAACWAETGIVQSILLHTYSGWLVTGFLGQNWLVGLVWLVDFARIQNEFNLRPRQQTSPLVFVQSIPNSQ